MRAFLVAAVLAVLILAALPRPVEAGPEPPSPFATAYNTQRKLARSTDGVLYAAVTKNVSGTPTVRVLSTTDGANWTTLPPPTTTGLASDRSSLAIDSLGRLHLVWTELAIAGGQVFYARFAANVWSAPDQLSHSPGYAGFPSLAVDAQDRPHVAWYGFDGTFYQIYYRRLETTGWTSETALTNEAVDATNPALALGRDGAVHIAWFRQNRQGTLNEVAYLRLVNDVIVETSVVSPPGIDAVNPSLLVDLEHRARMAWSAAAGVSRIQYIEKTLNDTWSAVEFVSPGGVGAMHPSLAMERGGPVRIVWEGADAQIYDQNRSSGSWSAPVQISSGGVNRYPNARWAQYNNPLCPSTLGVDVVWTHDEAGITSLSWASLNSELPCRSIPKARSPFLLIAAGVLALIASVAIAAILLRRRRKWYPPPPTG